MDKTKLEQLNDCFKEAMDSNSRYVGVAIDVGLNAVETIINNHENFADKLKYYNLAYDQGLEHKHAEGIHIVAFTHGDSFSEIESKLGLYIASSSVLH
jgi:hypothetical protein